MAVFPLGVGGCGYLIQPDGRSVRRCSPEPAAAEQQQQHNDQHDQTNAAEAAAAIVPTAISAVPAP